VRGTTDGDRGAAPMERGRGERSFRP
jgi:hypothetical protein